ncbi:MAG: primosomal protein N', partial [Bacteroidaceae bacterium]|nr:primosomal protein N' [Bacteroidaceae bacterium]
DIRLLDEAAERYGAAMRATFGIRVLGPDLPPVARVQQQYIRKIMLKVEAGVSQYKVNEALIAIREQFLTQKRYANITIFYDVDPL